jgi:hypothetical protein
MKNISTLLLCACISFISLSAFSQTQGQGAPPVNEPDYNKPKLFAAYPEKIPVNLTIVNNMLSASLGATVDMNIAEGGTASFRFAGEVVSTASKYDNRITSVVVRSTNFPGARLSINKIQTDDGNVKYTGRLISRQYGDVYELQSINNKFVLVKRAYYDIVNE